MIEAKWVMLLSQNSMQYMIDGDARMCAVMAVLIRGKDDLVRDTTRHLACGTCILLPSHLEACTIPA